MNIKLKKLKSLGEWAGKHWKQTSAERKREDIVVKQQYLVSYCDVWLIGEFHMQWYGWNFHPNFGSMSMQIEWLKDIYLINGLPRKKDGSTAAHILGYLKEESEQNAELGEE